MKRVLKKLDSQIVTQQLNYIVNGDNTKLRDLLFAEQKGFCAYTETYLGRTDKKEIDHFNPTLKGKSTDNYDNWFLIKAQWNSEKSSKWIKFQPVMPPTTLNLEERIIYSNGDYLVANSNDIEARNLVELLKLDDADLASERKKYITRKRDEIVQSGIPPIDFFQILINEDLNSIRFLRAIEKEFNVNVYKLLP